MLTALVFAFILTRPVAAADITIRVGHFPNVTHVQALVARNFERQNNSWFHPPRSGGEDRMVCLQCRTKRDGGDFCQSIDLTYVGPSPALNAYFRSHGDEVRVVAGAVNGGSALVVQPDSGLKTPADFRGKRIATPQFGNTQDVAARAWLNAGGLRITQTGGDAQVVPTRIPTSSRCSRQSSSMPCGRWNPGCHASKRKPAVRFLSTRRPRSRRFWCRASSSCATIAIWQRVLSQPIANSRSGSYITPTKRRGWSTRVIRDGKGKTAPRSGVARMNRMQITSDASVEQFRSWVEDTRRVGFIKEPPICRASSRAVAMTATLHIPPRRCCPLPSHALQSAGKAGGWIDGISKRSETRRGQALDNVLRTSARRIRLPRGPQRLRQDHAAQHHRRADPAGRGQVS